MRAEESGHAPMRVTRFGWRSLLKTSTYNHKKKVNPSRGKSVQNHSFLLVNTSIWGDGCTQPRQRLGGMGVCNVTLVNDNKDIVSD